jgi:uncharacterized protein YndB with AHSA1/START domain
MKSNSTGLVQHIDAPRPDVYRALIDPRAVASWMMPDGMTSFIHFFNPQECGGFRILLTYSDPDAVGKTTGRTDTYHGTFVRLVPNETVVETVEFETTDEGMRGESTITFSLSDAEGGTDVLAIHDHLPPGLSPADNETGWRMSLEKLARLVESGQQE